MGFLFMLPLRRASRPEHSGVFLYLPATTEFLAEGGDHMVLEFLIKLPNQICIGLPEAIPVLYGYAGLSILG